MESEIKVFCCLFECKSCGTKIVSKRKIVIDDCLNNLKIVVPQCSCGNKSRSHLKLLDLCFEEEKK